MHAQATAQSCGQCAHHETMLAEITEGNLSFPGLEFWCRREGSTYFNQRVQGPEASQCGFFAGGTGGSDAPD